MIDAPAILHDYLLNQAELTVKTAARIWPERVFPPEDAYYTPSVGPAIAFRARPGSLIANQRVLSASWQFKCYGASEYAANDLYRTLVDVLHDAKGSGILTANVEISGQTLDEPVTGWKYVLCFFETRMKSDLPTPV